ncbi:MAG TPA: hypothetical protein GX731_02045 [Clostridiales bacterium]|nr:hypothetical protein [Clostridiales bacterium]
MKNHVFGITGSIVPYYKDLNAYTGSGFLGNQLSQFPEMRKVSFQRWRM